MFGAFELDDELYELRRDGRPVEVRPRVFDVLLYLVTHRDRLVSKEELLQQVWSGEIIHEGVIPQNVAILRRLLGDSREAAQVIQTVHGRGYRFVADVSARRTEKSIPPPAIERPATPGQPFVGRERVMEELRRLMAEAIAGKGRLAFITGEAGIGKTRTTEEFAAEARALGARVLEGRCYEGEGAPAYWPWLQILRAAADEAERAASSERRDEGGAAARGRALRAQFDSLPRAQPLDSAEARFRLFEEIAAFLADLARRKPLLLILDDLHWADDATLHLLRFLSREVRGLPLLLLGTSRDLHEREGLPSATLLGGLIAHASVHRTYLSGLTKELTGELASAALQRELDPRTVAEVYALTEGNPFFVQEMLRLLADDSANGADPERWRRDLPGRVREVIDLRLQGLSPELQRLLALASVIGRHFSLAVLESVAELPRAQLLELLETAVRTRIVRASGDPAALERGAEDSPGYYAFAHALIRESLYAALPEPERVRLHERVGRAMEAVRGADPNALLEELAYHFYRAASGGAVEAAVRYCVRAAEHALRLLAFEQAVLHYRRALEALACRLPIDELQRFELKLALGSALFRARQDGNPALLGAAETARKLGRPDLLARVALAMRGWPLVVRRGRTQNRELYPLLAEALAAGLEDAPVLRTRLLSALVLNSPNDTDPATLAQRSREALALARSLGDDETLYDALMSRLRFVEAPGDTQQRLELANELVAAAERLGQSELVFSAHEQRVQPLLALGDLAEADREIAICTRLAEESGLPRCKLVALRFRLERAFGDGRFGELRGLTEQAVRARGPAEVSPGYLATIYIWRTFARGFRGERAWFERNIGPLAVEVGKATLYRSHIAHLYAVFGRQAEARATYAPLLDPDFLDHVNDDGWLMTVALTADAVIACADRAAAAVLYPRLLPHAALNVTHMEWLIYLGSCEHWLGGLAALLGKRDAAIAHFESALAHNAKLGARPFVARTSFEYARLLLASGTPQSEAESALARSLLRDATELAGELGMQELARQAAALTV